MRGWGWQGWAREDKQVPDLMRLSCGSRADKVKQVLVVVRFLRKARTYHDNQVLHAVQIRC